jgi:transcriptional regulator with XRE-family HTH domain
MAITIYVFFISLVLMIEKAEFNHLFGAFVRHKRQEKSLSQSQLANSFGIMAQNISRIERGEVSPTLYWVNKLAIVFDQDLSEFISEFVEFVSLKER